MYIQYENYVCPDWEPMFGDCTALVTRPRALTGAAGTARMVYLAWAPGQGLANPGAVFVHRSGRLQFHVDVDDGLLERVIGDVDSMLRAAGCTFTGRAVRNRMVSKEFESPRF